MTENLSSSVDYTDKPFHASKLKYSKRYTTNGQPSSFTCLQSSESSWYRFLAVDVGDFVNPSKTTLNCQLDLAADIALANHVEVSAFSIVQQMKVQNSLGEVLFETTNLPRYLRSTLFQNMMYQKFKTRDMSECTYPSNSAVASNPCCPYSGGAFLPTYVNYDDIKYQEVSAVPGALSLKFSFALGDIVHTILACNKVLYTGVDHVEVLLTFAPYDKFCWKSTGITVSNAPVISDIHMRVAIETNEQLKDSIKGRFDSSGLEVLYEYPMLWNQAASTSTTRSNTININKGLGDYLTRMYITAFNATEALTLNLDNNNTAAKKIATIQTQLNHVNQRDNRLVCDSLDVWNEMKEQLSGTVIQRKDQFDNIFTFQENYEGDVAKDEEGNLIRGKYIGSGDGVGDLKWTYDLTCSTDNTSLYIFGVVLRKALFAKDKIHPRVLMPNYHE